MSDQIEELLAGCPTAMEIPVVWGDMDAFQHVNNVQYFRYFESARARFAEQLGMWETMQEANIIGVVKETNCQYKFPLFYPDDVWATARALKAAGHELLIEHHVISRTHHKIAAVGTATIVAFDSKNQRKTTLPQLWLGRLAQMQPACDWS